MSDAIITALISLAGSALGVMAGVIGSSKLTEFRLSNIESKVDELDKKMDSMADNSICDLSNRLVAIETRIDILERK